MQTIIPIQREIRAQANSQKAKILAGFFKMGKGEYGEGDKFLGITVPVLRRIVRAHVDATWTDIRTLFHSPYHEERLVAALMLVHRFEAGGSAERKKVFDFYLANTRYINNWDLVDLSASKIVGAYLFEKNRLVLYRLAKSKSLWERRIGIISTLYFICSGEDTETYKLASVFIGDRHDLMHKAVGWMLREAGKRVSEKRLCEFLDRYSARMPRTMLRYSIERLPPTLRRKYLSRV